MKRNGIYCVVLAALVSYLFTGCTSTSKKKNMRLTESKQKVTHNSSIPFSQLPESPFNKIHYYTSTKRILATLDRLHYVDTDFNDDFSEKVFEQIVYAIDPNFEYLTLEKFNRSIETQHSFDDILITNNLSQAYSFIDSLLQIKEQSLSEIINLIGDDLPLVNNQETIKRLLPVQQPRSKLELEKYWIKKIKVEKQELYLLGAKKEQINSILKQRYLKLRDETKEMALEQKYSLLINSYTHSIDPHSHYLPPILPSHYRTVADISDSSEIKYGLGLVLKNIKGELKVFEVYPSSPADLAGVQQGDILVAIVNGDGRYIDLQEMEAEKAQTLLKGKPGTHVKLKLLRSSASDIKIVEQSIVNDRYSLSDFKVKSQIQTSALNSNEIGVITIPSFYNGVANDVRKELEVLKEQNIHGLIIDLRNNGGGSLYEPTKIASLFLKSGPVFQVRNSNKEVSVNVIKDNNIEYHGPISVLVNGSSAGASEILAAAIQDYGRGIVLGEQTFGYGTVQQHRPIGRVYDLYEEPLGSVQFTVAKFYRINGESTQHKGVYPDLVLKDNKFIAERENMKLNSLPWDTITKTKYDLAKNASNVKVAVKRLQKKYDNKSDKVMLEPSVLLNKAVEITDSYLLEMGNKD